MLFGVGILRSLEPVGTVASPLSLSVLGTFLRTALIFSVSPLSRK